MVYFKLQCLIILLVVVKFCSCFTNWNLFKDQLNENYELENNDISDNALLSFDYYDKDLGINDQDLTKREKKRKEVHCYEEEEIINYEDLGINEDQYDFYPVELKGKICKQWTHKSKAPQCNSCVSATKCHQATRENMVYFMKKKATLRNEWIKRNITIFFDGCACHKRRSV